MQIEIVELEERKCKFILRNSTPARANALRRTMLSDIPKMAIDEVEFHLGPIDVDGKEFESITPLFDEIIAHRLGMVPVPTDYERFTTREKCACNGEGCPSCRVMYSLNKHGPCTVLSRDLQPLGDASLKVEDEDIPIVELADGQSVLIYAYAGMGTARKHVKWQAAFGVGYKYLPKIEIVSSDIDKDTAKEIVKKCPKQVFDIVNGELKVKEDCVCDCSLCNTCTEISGDKIIVSDDKEGCDKSNPEARNFFFKFETDGSLTAKQVLDKAAEILSQESKTFSDLVSAL